MLSNLFFLLLFCVTSFSPSLFSVTFLENFPSLYLLYTVIKSNAIFSFLIPGELFFYIETGVTSLDIKDQNNSKSSGYIYFLKCYIIPTSMHIGGS